MAPQGFINVRLGNVHTIYLHNENGIQDGSQGTGWFIYLWFIFLYIFYTFYIYGLYFLFIYGLCFLYLWSIFLITLNEFFSGYKHNFFVQVMMPRVKNLLASDLEGIVNSRRTTTSTTYQEVILIKFDLRKAKTMEV